MDIYTVFYQFWDSFEILYVGTSLADAQNVKRAQHHTRLQTWRDGVMLSEEV